MPIARSRPNRKAPRDRSRRTIALPGCAVLACVVLGCGPPPPPATLPVDSVLLISIDTLRPDRLGVYDRSRKTSPNLDRFAEQSAVFHHAVSSNPLTLPSHATMLTGMDPTRHGVHDNSTYRLPEARLTLAEALRQRGMRTAAVVGAVVLGRAFGLAQGFESYDDEISERDPRVGDLSFARRDARDVTDRAVERLRAIANEPFFLFVHYYDPHAPWTAPTGWGERFDNDGYAAEIAYTDNEIGRLLGELDAVDRSDSTAVIVTADHGESLGAFGEGSHSFFIYQATQAVPLIVHVPGMQRRRDIEAAVGTVDIAPTVLDLLGDDPAAEMQGRSLAPLWGGEGADDGAERVLYAESLTPTKVGCNPLFAVVTTRWKYIHTLRPELYDLEADPGEQHDRIDSDPEVAAHLRAELEQLVADEAGRMGDQPEVDEATRRQLEGLGYLAARVDDRLEIDASRSDPKDCLRDYEQYAILMALAHDEKWDAVRATATEILERRPGLTDAYRFLGLAAAGQKRWAEARSHLQLYLALSADATAEIAVGAAAQRAEAYDALAQACRALGLEGEADDAAHKAHALR